MGMMATAAADLSAITLEDGEDVTIQNPSGETADFKAFTQDIFLMVDPGTGQVIGGRQCTVSIPISALSEAGFRGVHGVHDSKSRPWLVTWTDATGQSVALKVVESHPDSTIGNMILRLEAYRPL
jgi:hypothetical protein